ncbi:MAG: hypothetical protein J6S91_05845 [Treponema sp.]|nr:hypothetical protein [Treponema sp.]
MKAKEGIRDIISMTLLALMTILVIFASVYTSSKKNAGDALQVIERDKVDCTILPSPRGKNPFVGKSFELRNESSLRRFDFAEGGELYLTEPCVLDKRLTVTLESKCDYTWNADTQELFVKPVAYKIDEDYSPYSIQLERHYTGKALELLDKLPYPWYSEQDRSTAAGLLQRYFSNMVDSTLFEVEKYSYDVQDHGLMLEKKEEDLFADFISFSSIEDEKETVLKLSRRQLVLSCPDDSGNSIFFSGIPEFDDETKYCRCSLHRQIYEDSIQIESGSRVMLSILPVEKDDANGMVSVKIQIHEIPEEAKIREGQILEGMVKSVGDLVWLGLVNEP